MISLDDRLARVIGVPAFGIAIPLLTGLYRGLTPRDATAWLGAVVFVALSFSIWHGNRWLLFRRRGSRDWLERPIRRLALLVAGIVLFTAPLTIAVMLLWREISGVDIDAATIRTVTLMNVICVVFVAHFYESVLLIKERESDLLRVERVERARAEAELLALRRQVDPHFIFNCLNTLQHLIDHDPQRAKSFNQDLASVTRYLLATSDREMVRLEEELAFVRRFTGLLAIRFGDAFAVQIRGDADGSVPPTSLQLLVENAAKHNAFTPASPLVVQIDVSRDRVVVTNARVRRDGVAGEGLGLANLATRVRLGTGRELEVDASDTEFRVVVPVAA